MAHAIPLNNDEIEVACDLLWFVKRTTALSGVGEALWEQLNPSDTGTTAGVPRRICRTMKRVPS